MSPREAGPDADVPDPALVEGGRRRLAVVAAVLVAEALALAVFAGYLTVNLVAGSEETTETSNTVIETVAFFVFAVLLALIGRGAWRCRRWSRAPVLVTQLIALLGPGLTILQGDLWYRFVLGVPLAAGAAAAILLMLTPSATAAIEATESAAA